MEISDILFLTPFIFVTAFATHFLVVYLYKLKRNRKTMSTKIEKQVSDALIIQHLENINSGMIEVRSNVKKLSESQSEMKIDIAIMKTNADHSIELKKTVSVQGVKLDAVISKNSKLAGMYLAGSFSLSVIVSLLIALYKTKGG